MWASAIRGYHEGRHASRRHKVKKCITKQKGTIGLPLSHPFSLAVGIGGIGVPRQSTGTLELRLAVHCVLPGAIVSCHLYRHRSALPVPSLTIVDKDGVGLLKSVSLHQSPRCPLQETISDPERPPFNPILMRLVPISERYCHCISMGHHSPYTVRGPYGSDPLTRVP